jgi:hypothetical protein
MYDDIDDNVDIKLCFNGFCSDWVAPLLKQTSVQRLQAVSAAFSFLE